MPYNNNEQCKVENDTAQTKFNDGIQRCIERMLTRHYEEFWQTWKLWWRYVWMIRVQFELQTNENVPRQFLQICSAVCHFWLSYDTHRFSAYPIKSQFLFLFCIFFGGLLIFFIHSVPNCSKLSLFFFVGQLTAIWHRMYLTTIANCWTINMLVRFCAKYLIYEEIRRAFENNLPKKVARISRDCFC